jgi:DNA-binding transcriptional LysR family regulator
MELRHLRYFVAIADTGSFRKAAEKLRIAQPALTRQITALERTLGVQLFEPGPRRRALGPAGRTFLDDARAILQAVEVSEQRLRVFSGKNRTRFRISFTEVASNEAKFSSFITQLRKAIPRVAIEMLPMSSVQQAEALLKGHVDVGCLYRLPDMDPRIFMHHLMDDPIVAVLPKSHRLARRSTVRLAHLQTERLLLVSRSVFGELYRSVVQSFRDARLRVPTIEEEANTAQVMSMVSVGMGIGLLTSAAARTKLPLGSVYRPIDDFNCTLELALAWRKGNPTSSMLERVTGTTDSGAPTSA